HDARDDRHARSMADVCHSIHGSRLETRVGEDDFLQRLRGRIAVVGRLDVGPQDGTNLRDLGEQPQGCRLRLGAAVLAVGSRDGASALEAQPPLDLCAEPPGDRAHARHRAGREVGRDEVARLEVSGEEHAQQILHHAPDDLAAREAPAFEVGELSPPPVAREDRADTVLELAVVGRRHGVTTLDRLPPDVDLDEPEILVHSPRDLREDIRGALVAGLVGLIDGVTGTLTTGGQRGRERVDVVPLRCRQEGVSLPLRGRGSLAACLTTASLVTSTSDSTRPPAARWGTTGTARTASSCTRPPGSPARPGSSRSSTVGTAMTTSSWRRRVARRSTPDGTRTW